MDIHYLQLKGKVNIGEPLAIGKDFAISILGSITGANKDDENNGDFSVTWKFEPLTVEVLTPRGETLKADKFKQSQKMRMALKRKWELSTEEMDFPEYYKRETDKIIADINGQEA